MSEHGLLSCSELDEELVVLNLAFNQTKAEVKETETRLKEVNRALRLLGQYHRTKKAYQSYRKSKNKKVFRTEHRSELELYDAAVKELREVYGEDRFLSIKELKSEKAELVHKKAEQYETYCQAREKWMEVGTIVRNRDTFLEKQRERERSTTTKG